MINVALNITYRCNARCRFCDRMSDVLDIQESDISMEKLGEFIQDVREMDYYVKCLRVTGGEPTVHPRFAEVMQRIDDELLRPGIVRRGRLVTNHTNAYTLPSWKWSCYSVRLPDKWHVPFGVSPADMGVAPSQPITQCAVQQNCGIGYDYRGWAMCQVAPNLGRLLGIEVHREKISLAMDKPVCDHCIYCLPRKVSHRMKKDVDAGKLACPSPTIANALRACRQTRPSALVKLETKWKLPENEKEKQVYGLDE